jgi:hypothetical protein
VTQSQYIVGIVVDPSVGDELGALLIRMPVWIAATESNRRAAEKAWSGRPSVKFTEAGGETTFRVDPRGTPEDWFVEVLGDVAGHHDRYSHSPGYSAIEVVGVTATPRLLALLASYRLSLVSPRPNGFVAATPDGDPAASPNDDVPPPEQ